VKSQDFSSRAVRRSSLKSRKAFLHIFTLPIEALLVKSFRFASLVKRSASHPVKLLPDGSKDGGTGKTHLRCLNNGKAAKTFFLTVLLRHGVRHAVRIFYGGCLALLALRACVTQARYRVESLRTLPFFCPNFGQKT